jgi:hypothetical protein
MLLPLKYPCVADLTNTSKGDHTMKKQIKRDRYVIGFSSITQKHSVWDADRADRVSEHETEAEAKAAARRYNEADARRARR